MSIARALRYISQPYRIIVSRRFVGMFGKNIPDILYLKCMYHSLTGKRLNLQQPTGFNEKLNYLKLYDRKSIYTRMVDKFEAKEWAASIIGDSYIIPTLGCWEKFDDIDFALLPDQFVLKCTHDSAGVIVVKDKSEFDKGYAKRKIESYLKNNFFWVGREWPYKNVKPRIIAEKFMAQDNNYGGADELIDYKFYCFNGIPKFLYVAQANFSNGEKHDQLKYLDFEWNPTPFDRPDHSKLKIDIPKPDKLDEMIVLASKLSQGIPFIRADFYYTNKQIFFSEVTFFPGSGFGLFSPEEWEIKIGSWIDLSNI